MLPTNTFNSKITEIENKIKTAEGKIYDISGLATKTSVDNLARKTQLKNVENKLSDYATEISGIKNDYATRAILDSKLSELKTTHIANEVKKVDDKVSKNSNDILGSENRLKQKEDLTNDLEREVSYFREKHNYDRDGLQNYLA